MNTAAIPGATPAILSVLQLRIEASDPEAARLCAAYREAEEDRRRSRTFYARSPNPDYPPLIAQAIEARADAAAALQSFLDGRGETAATIRQLLADIEASITRRGLWQCERTKAWLLEWFESGMTHLEFGARLLPPGVAVYALSEHTIDSMWRDMLPELTLAAVLDHWDRDRGYSMPDDHPEAGAISRGD